MPLLRICVGMERFLLLFFPIVESFPLWKFRSVLDNWGANPSFGVWQFTSTLVVTALYQGPSPRASNLCSNLHTSCLGGRSASMGPCRQCMCARGAVLFLCAQFSASRDTSLPAGAASHSFTCIECSTRQCWSAYSLQGLAVQVPNPLLPS